MKFFSLMLRIYSAILYNLYLITVTLSKIVLLSRCPAFFNSLQLLWVDTFFKYNILI
jgi:hypothetical protein